MTTAVIGREGEQSAIQSLIATVGDGPQALVLSGEPGIGKTVLWEEGLSEAKQQSRRVLVHRSVEAETSLSFTALSDLLAPVFDDVASSLAPLRRRALEVALLLSEPGAEPPNPRAIGLALLDVLRALADRGPVLVALDDLQWLDSSSAGVLQIALRRLSDEPVSLLATVRQAPDVTAPLELDATFQEERLNRIVLGPLSLGALHHLLNERVGLELSRPELARVQEASAGNPFFALELARELVRTGTRPEAGRALRVPESLHELLDGRLARLPTETGDVVLFAAALARPTVELVAAAHGDRADVLEALDSAEREGVIVRSTTRAFGLRTPCSHRSATSRQSPGSGARFTERSPRWSSISRSGRVTWRSRSRGRTQSPPPSSTRPRSRQRHAARPPLLRSSASWRPG